MKVELVYLTTLYPTNNEELIAGLDRYKSGFYLTIEDDPFAAGNLRIKVFKTV